MLDGEAKAAVAKAFRKAADKGKAPVLLRLVFHDAGTYAAASGDGGANGSLRFELDRPENRGLKRGWRVLEAVNGELRGTAAEGQLSYADLVALGGAWAVGATGGPTIEVPVGRRDAGAADPVDRMPAETLTAEQLRGAFAAKGISEQELVALSGAHTLGGKGFGEPLKFDNMYFRTLLAKPWADPANEMGSMVGLPSDHVLPEDEALRPVIVLYAADERRFFNDFAAAYLKLTSLGAVWG
ncbi:hypothetical protein WJX81_003173 [Elliptochloris bilobata]|uniref:L-ascorbate peroxidase n=1 Tax=Elliptochloris bilobata TaxID=381761 RepID=A0AAW1S3K7_9CHLO